MRYLAVVFLIVSHQSFAQSSAQYRACNDKAKNQAEMNACASEEAARLDSQLNDVYRRVLSQAQGQQAAVAKIKIVERAWIAFRDAYIGASSALQGRAD